MSNDDEMTRSVSRKRAALEARLSEGRVQIHLDSTIEGVTLPAYLMDQVQVILNLSYGFKSEVFVIDDEGVQVTLSFSGKKFLCILPWACIYVMQKLDANGTIAGESEIFFESLPAVIVKQVPKGRQDDESDDPAPPSGPEGEHTPEKGIISLKRFQKDQEGGSN